MDGKLASYKRFELKFTRMLLQHFVKNTSVLPEGACESQHVEKVMSQTRFDPNFLSQKVEFYFSSGNGQEVGGPLG